jgi:small GTP-binding protein
MSFPSLLDAQQKRIWSELQSTLRETVDTLGAWDPDNAELEHLRQALQQLHELFLLVVVGEFNSGKSALINALLGAPYLKEGVTPTTDRVYVLKYGEPGPSEYIRENVQALRYPVEILREMHIVDTPGTNAVLRQHETITRDFVPRSDMVIFVTSADRPFTESERGFMQAIRSWGKKVVLVVNKVDILQDAGEIHEVETFVLEQARRLLDFEPELFSLSARAGVQLAEHPEEESAEASSQGFIHFREYLQRTLTQEGLVRLKLLSPVGVALHVSHVYAQNAQDREQVLQADLHTLTQVDKKIEAYRVDTGAEFERHQARIENDLLQMSLRGEAFLDEHMRLLKVVDMLRSRRMRAAFEDQVVGDTPEMVEAHVAEVIDWLVERDLSLWREVAQALDQRKDTETLQDAARQAAGGFTYNRRQLLEGLGAQAEAVIRTYNRSAEAERLTMTLQDSVAMVGLVEVSAIGLGLVLKALLTTAAADATGLLAAGILGVMGLAIIPFRRGAAKREFRQKMSELRDQLSRTLSGSFLRELDRSIERMREALAPYRRFVKGEQEQVEGLLDFLAEVDHKLHAFKAELES